VHRNSDGFAVGFARHLGVPDLRGAAAVNETRGATNAAFARCAQEIRLEFRGREARRAGGQAIQAAESGCRIRQRHHARGMKKAGRRQVMRPDVETAFNGASFHPQPLEAEQTGQAALLVSLHRCGSLGR